MFEVLYYGRTRKLMNLDKSVQQNVNTKHSKLLQDWLKLSQEF